MAQMIRRVEALFRHLRYGDFSRIAQKTKMLLQRELKE